MVAIYEKFRPKTFDEFCGFHEVISRIFGLKDSIGLDGQVFWITGASGSGKTTLARLIANDVASDWDIDEMDAQDVKLETLEEWRRRCHYCPQKDAYAFIVNEAHTLPTRTVSKLQTLLEEPCIQKYATVIFTTTDRGQQRLFDTRFDAFPFLSRAITLELDLDDATCHAMVDRLGKIESQVFQRKRTDGEYRSLLRKHQGNMRFCLQDIASNASTKEGVH